MSLSKSRIYFFHTCFSHLVVLAPGGTEKGNMQCLTSVMTEANQPFLLSSIAVISMTILSVYWLKFTGLQKTLTMCLVVDVESYALARGIVLLES